MKSPKSLVGLSTFHVREHERKLLQLETMENEFQKMVDALDKQIHNEEIRSGISDINHYAYPIFAKTARIRRDNLILSIENLEERKKATIELLDKAKKDLEKAQALAKREKPKETETKTEKARYRRVMIG